MRILIVNGPNLNLLGTREPEIYGKMTYESLNEELQAYAKKNKLSLEIRQSNLEGIIIDLLHYAAFEKFDGVCLNAAAYTHYAYAIYDAIKAIDVPVVEVHLTDPARRPEPFRKVSVIEDACVATFKGEGITSYKKAIAYLCGVENHDH